MNIDYKRHIIKNILKNIKSSTDILLFNGYSIKFNWGNIVIKKIQ